MKLRSFLSTALLAVIPFLVGCQPLAPGSTQQQVADYVITNSAQVKATAVGSTRLALLTVSPANRAEATAEVHTVALAIQSALSQSNPDLTGAISLAMDAIQKQHGKYSDVIVVVLDSGSALISAELQKAYASLSTTQQGQVALALIRAVVDGVVQATSPPASAVSTQPSAMISPGIRIFSPFEAACLF